MKTKKVHKGRINDVCYSKGGEYFFTASQDSRILVIDPVAGYSIVREFKDPNQSESVEKLAPSPVDKNLLLASSLDKTVKLWDVREKAPVRVEKFKVSNSSLAWRPDGKQFATCMKYQSVSFFEMDKPNCASLLKFDAATIKDSSTPLGNVGVTDITWDTTGDLFIATTEKEHSVLLFDTSNEKLPEFPCDFSFLFHASVCNAIALDPTGKLCATSGADDIVSVFSATEFITQKTLTSFTNQILRLGFSHDGQYLAVSSERKLDKTQLRYLSFYDTKSGDMIDEPSITGAVNCFAWHPTRRVFAFVCDEKPKGSAIAQTENLGSFHWLGMPDEAPPKPQVGLVPSTSGLAIAGPPILHKPTLPVQTF